MINYVFAAEFDILKGCIIRAHYPRSFVSFNDGMLASYMIPDGAHKHELDLNVFRYKLMDSKFQFDRQSLWLNSTPILITTLKYDQRFERWEPLAGEGPGEMQTRPKDKPSSNFGQHQRSDNFENRGSLSKDSDFMLQMNMDESPIINKMNLDKFSVTNNYHPSKESSTTKLLEKQSNLRKPSGSGNQVLKIRNYKQLQVVSGSEEDQKVLLDIEIHKDLQFTRLNENFCSFYTREGSSFGFNFASKDSAEAVCRYVNEIEQSLNADSQGGLTESSFFFYNVVKTKKDHNLKRGSLIRSIAVCSRDLNCLSFLQKLILNYLDVYLKFPLHENQTGQLEGILQELYKISNEVVTETPAGLLRTPSKGSLVYIPFEVEENCCKVTKKIKVTGGRVLELQIEQSHYRNFAEASLLELVKRFREKTMMIFNSILREEKILFVGYECPIKDLANIVCATAFLVFPLNTFDKIFPYEHLLNMDFVQEESYIAGVSNPLFMSRKGWWDICCDISNGSVIEAASIQGGAKPASNLSKLISKSPEELGDLKLAYLDNDFILGVLKKIKENDITELELRGNFYEYTRNYLELFMNSTNMLDYEKDDKTLLDALQRRATKFKKTRFFDHCLAYPDMLRAKLSAIFGEKYIALYKAINMLKDKRILNDYELIFLYSTLYENMDSAEKTKEVLELILTGKYCTEALSAGLFSSNEDVTRKTLALFEVLESDALGQKIIKKFNYYILFVYQNMRNRLHVAGNF